MTNYYTINYASKLLDDVKVSESKRSKCAPPSGQNDTMEEVKVKRSIRSKRTAVIGSNCTDDPTEITTESTTENKNPSCPEASQPDDAGKQDDFLTRYPTAVVYSAAKRQWGSQEDLTCAEWLWGRIIKLYEQAAESDGEVVRPKEPNWITWSNEVRLMCSQDGRTHRQICELYGRVNRDPFWCKNILSPSKLREKWDELSLKLSPVGAGGPRSDNAFKSSYENVDYSQIPSGFRG